MRNITFRHRSKDGGQPNLDESKPWLKTAANNPSRFTLPRLVKRIILGIFVVGVCLWIFFASPWFAATTIEIEGLVSDDTRRVLEGLKGRNIFLLGNSFTERALLEQEPRLKQIQIVRGIPHLVHVKAIERTPSASWQSNGSWYSIDADGIPFKSLTGQNSTPIIDDANVSVEMGKQVAARDFLEFVQAVEKVLPSVVDLRMIEAHVGESTFFVRIKTDKQIEILLDTTAPIDRQLDAVKRLWFAKKDEVKQYIDARVEGYVYYQ